ncbi:ABC transporter substrate-binding protein [Motiliproteus sp. MSK22-1]|uniref:ABC transporter substrate-binding protein n=1 Tax=Motiliproteus sp. MSK22-1 TaxID=1897630 RepID=UPI000978A717|nr:ABC transporter substrate binding protein [Motiliproteus sp. MSK22-1]OMH32746.1 hypothetical protein BGP75_14570 [Motiliproteus sp. MSK22-1]
MNRGKRTLVLLIIGLYLPIVLAYADTPDFRVPPIDNNGQRWRIAYYQGGAYVGYYDRLLATVSALMEMGWIEKADLPPEGQDDARNLWLRLSTTIESEYLEFVENGYYSADWDLQGREELRNSIINRLNHTDDIDLVVAMGTWAGKDLANDEHKIPTVVVSSSDPIGAGIIPNVEDSGYDHLHVHNDPYRYERQVRLFYELIGFGTLGVAYEDTVVGRSYAAINAVNKVAAESGFKVEHCHTQSDIANQSIADQSVIECFKQLVKKVDAIYVTAQGGVNSKTIPMLVKIANSARVPTFSQYGDEEVRQGYLLSLSPSGHQSLGEFHAQTIAKILSGISPGDIAQVYEGTKNIVINLETAEIIGLYLYADMLAAADKIYRKIEVPE